MSIKAVFRKILHKLHIIDITDYRSIEYLRSKGVKIGENVNLYNTTIDYGHGFLVSIGNNVTLTGVTVLAHDASTQIPLKVSKVGRVMIGNNVFVGHGTIILPNVTIGDNCIIGAGSVVCRDIPSNSVAAGNPINVIATYDEFVAKHIRSMQEKPVYPTHWSQKSNEEKEQMWNDLSETFGYDQ